MFNSAVFDTDSYKLNHWTQYPPGTTAMMSYFESRGGLFEECTLFGCSACSNSTSLSR